MLQHGHQTHQCPWGGGGEEPWRKAGCKGNQCSARVSRRHTNRYAVHTTLTCWAISPSHNSTVQQPYMLAEYITTFFGGGTGVGRGGFLVWDAWHGGATLGCWVDHTAGQLTKTPEHPSCDPCIPLL